MTIIVILFMLILPAFNSVKESARRSECLSRVRSIAQAAQLHAALFNGQAPITTTLRLPTGAGDPKKMFDTVDGGPAMTDWQPRIMLALDPEAVKTDAPIRVWTGRKHPSWWAFICTNVLPYWNAGSSINAQGYTKGEPNALMDELYNVIKPGKQDTNTPVMYSNGRGPDSTSGHVKVFGNFAMNFNRVRDATTRTYEITQGQTVTENLLHMSQIKSPEKRAFFTEEGEATANDDSAAYHNLVRYPPYTLPIRRSGHGDDAPGYVPGLGGGGIGKEKMERIGFADEMYDELDDERFELVKKDVMEGRHGGATLYGFFDGHAEAIPVETVGSCQLGPGDTLDDLKGPHGPLKKAADDDE